MARCHDNRNRRRKRRQRERLKQFQSEHKNVYGGVPFFSLGITSWHCDVFVRDHFHKQVKTLSSAVDDCSCMPVCDECGTDVTKDDLRGSVCWTCYHDEYDNSL